MSDALRARLLAAAAAGEIVSIVYHRGSQPGTVREIVPIAINDDEVRARDVAARMEKSFKLAHMELAAAQTLARVYNPAPPADDTPNLQAALEPHLAELRALGWHVETAARCVSVHRYFRNGKLRKGADVAVMFNEFVIDAWDDGSGWREAGVKSKRPFYVSSPTFDKARTFARLPLALALFLSEARKLAPRSRMA